ncbi:MAG: class I SAM-dependent methyltransferase, partial [Ignavibacteriae bacterium]|nr:class I SAM-dependent methyltransferase [Ignavibacteriota bacterium]
IEKNQIGEIEKIRSFWSKSDKKINKWDNSGTENISRLAKVSSKSKFWSSLIFNLIREFKPNNCLELGTCIGISAAYQAAAIKLNEKGKLITLEGSVERTKIANENFMNLQLDNVEISAGKFEDNLENILISNKTFDFIFLDGNHQYNSTIEYFNIILPYLENKSIIVVDDTNYSSEMNKAWKKLLENPNVEFSVDLFGLGVIFINKENVEQKKSNYSMGVIRL